jgi:hypothetical protein
MSGKSSYALQKIIERAIKAAKDAGLEVGGVDVKPDGTVTVLTKDSTKVDPFADWKKQREGVS